MTLKVTQDKTAAMRKAVDDLVKKRVLVGIPDSADKRDDSEFGNAAIGYLNEFGAPDMNIPPRPHLVPGVAGIKDKIVKRLKIAGQDALEGKAQAADAQLEAVGQEAVNAVDTKIADGEFTPLAPATLAARRRYAKKTGGQAVDKPLQLTGKYRNSITYVIRTKGGT
ncbi:hypothetical protein [Labrys neptuniae]